MENVVLPSYLSLEDSLLLLLALSSEVLEIVRFWIALDSLIRGGEAMGFSRLSLYSGDMKISGLVNSDDIDADQILIRPVRTHDVSRCDPPHD